MSEITETDPTRAPAQLTLGYLKREDRLLLALSGAPMVLTRALTRALINGLAGILERTSPLLTGTPAEMGEEMMSIEHHAALAGFPAAEPGGSAAPAGAARGEAPDLSAIRLVSDVDVATLPNQFRLTLRSGETALAQLSVGRQGLHRLIDALLRQAELAQWDITVAPWLTEDGTHWVLN